LFFNNTLLLHQIKENYKLILIHKIQIDDR